MTAPMLPPISAPSQEMKKASDTARMVCHGTASWVAPLQPSFDPDDQRQTTPCPKSTESGLIP